MKYVRNQNNESKNRETVETFSNIDIQKNQKVEMQGYEVIGIVNIPKINLEYPILNIETSNPEETKEPMKISIVKYWGGNVNDYGNLSIAGHNNYDGTMFGKTKQLETGDIVKLTDLNKNTINYEIYDKFVTDPNDVSILATNDKNIREVTLITCTDDSKHRVVVRCREKK